MKKVYIVNRSLATSVSKGDAVKVFFDKSQATSYIKENMVAYNNASDDYNRCFACKKNGDDIFLLENKCPMCSIKTDRNGKYCENDSSDNDKTFQGIYYYSLEESEMADESNLLSINGGIVETKFNIGDSVYVVDKHTIRENKECFICNGTGRVQIKSKDYVCPECKGRGILSSKLVSAYTVCDAVVTSIKITKSSNRVCVGYRCSVDYLNFYKKMFPECDNKIFATKEEAISACEKLNAEEGKI